MSALGIRLKDIKLPRPPAPHLGKVLRKAYESEPQTLEYYQQLLDHYMKRENYIDHLTSLPTDIEKFDYIYGKMTKYNFFDHIFQPDTKNNKKYAIHKSASSEFYQYEFYPNALESTIECLKQTNNRGEMAYAFACRAHILAQMDLHFQCLQDIERAFQHNIHRRYRNSLKLLREKAEKKNRPPELFHTPIPRIPVSKQNPQFPCARNSVQALKHSDGTWRYEAQRFIEIGEVVAVEEPVVFTLNSTKPYHCHHCLMLCYNPIPCEECTQVLYCGDKCQQEALQQYHGIECPILKSILAVIGRDHHLLTSFKASIIFKDQYSGNNEQLDDNVEIFNCKGYKEMCALMKSTDEDNIGDDHLIQLLIVSCFMWQLLKDHTNFFQENKTETDFKRFIVSHLRAATLYAREIVEIISDKNERPCPEPFGQGIYPFSATMKTSCKPNLHTNYYGVKRVHHAVRTIKCGEDFTVGLCPPYYESCRDERISKLVSRYNMYCDCQACEEDWPILAYYGWESIVEDYLPFLKCFTDLAVEEAERMIKTDLVPSLRLYYKEEPDDELSIMFFAFYICHWILGNSRRIP